MVGITITDGQENNMMNHDVGVREESLIIIEAS